MASVTIRRVWPDNDVLVVRVDIDASYPDAINEAKVVALSAYAKALGVTTADADEV